MIIETSVLKARQIDGNLFAVFDKEDSVLEARAHISYEDGMAWLELLYPANTYTLHLLQELMYKIEGVFNAN